MASSSSSSSSRFHPPRPPPPPTDDVPEEEDYTPSPLIVAREEFNAFHKRDRTLFGRFVFALGRDISQSLHVMAFLLWLEHVWQARNLVAYVVSLPDSFIGSLFDEVCLCLNSMHNEDFAFFAAHFGHDSLYEVLPLIKRLTKDHLTLRYVFENRKIVLHGIQKNMKEICIPILDDICKKAERLNKEKKIAEEKTKMQEEMNRLTIRRPAVRAPPVAFHGGMQPGESSQAAAQRQVVSSDPKSSVTEAPNAVKTSGGGNTGGSGSQEEQISVDDRTIFLTFSKGYPISESEVLTFFSRRFGEVIEAVYMQEVDENEQPLYARMVLHSPATIPVMLNNRIKNKFTINGKHVWARKYVPKAPRA